MRNVWLSMDHQSILWCNQLVVQVKPYCILFRSFFLYCASCHAASSSELNIGLQISHTLLSLISPEAGHPFPSSRKRLAIFTKMVQSGIPQSLNWKSRVHPSSASKGLPIKGVTVATGSVQNLSFLKSGLHCAGSVLLQLQKHATAF